MISPSFHHLGFIFEIYCFLNDNFGFVVTDANQLAATLDLKFSFLFKNLDMYSSIQYWDIIQRHVILYKGTFSWPLLFCIYSEITLCIRDDFVLSIWIRGVPFYQMVMYNCVIWALWFHFYFNIFKHSILTWTAILASSDGLFSTAFNFKVYMTDNFSHRIFVTKVLTKMSYYSWNIAYTHLNIFMAHDYYCCMVVNLSVSIGFTKFIFGFNIG